MSNNGLQVTSHRVMMDRWTVMLLLSNNSISIHVDQGFTHAAYLFEKFHSTNSKTVRFYLMYVCMYNVI